MAFGVQLSWKCVVKDDCVRSCFDRTSILSVEQTVYRPNTQCFDVFSTFSALYHARCGWVKSSLYGSLCSLSMGFTAVQNTVCLLAQNFVLPVSILNWWWNVNWLHIRYDKCTRRNRSELIHCPWMKDRWDCVLNDLEEELGGKEFLVLVDRYNIETFLVSSAFLPLYSSTYQCWDRTKSWKIILQSPEFNRSIFFSR